VPSSEVIASLGLEAVPRLEVVKTLVFNNTLKSKSKRANFYILNILFT